MPESLYEQDVLVWAEQQAALLRRLAAGERVNDAVDWPNVIEEVQDVGLSELHACESLLRQALVHLLKARGWPEAPAVAHWRGETVGFLSDAAQRFAPSMRQRISLDGLYRKALKQVLTGAKPGDPPRALPESCPFTLNELFAEDTEVEALAAKLG
jgi:Domain of unknown function DUF29